jgi:hypothetical protein
MSLDRGGSADHTRSVNAGLSPGDEHCDEPYLYVSPYPYPDATETPRLRTIGHWHTQGFAAAIAPANRIIRAENPQAATEAFLSDAVEASLQALDRDRYR